MVADDNMGGRRGRLEEYWRALLWQGTRILYALLGLLIRLPIAFFSLIGAVASADSAQSGSDGLMFGTLFGVGAVIFLPIFYGIIGLSAALSPSSSTT